MLISGGVDRLVTSNNPQDLSTILRVLRVTWTNSMLHGNQTPKIPRSLQPFMCALDIHGVPTEGPLKTSLQVTKTIRVRGDHLPRALNSDGNLLGAMIAMATTGAVQLPERCRRCLRGNGSFGASHNDCRVLRVNDQILFDGACISCLAQQGVRCTLANREIIDLEEEDEVQVVSGPADDDDIQMVPGPADGMV
ncbi:hypothetical protein DIS24_g5016 [Lasiodiplodia hormozganensis]|uniref:Uncharacterized protein n=1 Tax=Lasiodiplodia hormozganensis TaxID=869390 RepID=A0AA39YL32_9PEZI|nr:hypothetical protein DIS24_g5016 [Lasiodiplodia hormozganensis]